MAFLQHLFVGRFVSAGGSIRFRDQRPVCLEPLDRAVLDRLAAGWDYAPGACPPVGWRLHVGDDHLLADWSALPPNGLRFVAAYAAEANAQIMELGSLELVGPATLVREADERDRQRRRHPPLPGSDEAIHEYLTRGGTTPLNHYFVMDGEVREWKPSVGFSVGIRFYEDAFGAQCLDYLVRQGLTCEGRHQIPELAERYGWLNWGKMMLKLSPPTPTD